MFLLYQCGINEVLTSPTTEESEPSVIRSKDAAAHFVQLAKVYSVIPFGVLQQNHPLWTRDQAVRITTIHKQLT